MRTLLAITALVALSTAFGSDEELFAQQIVRDYNDRADAKVMEAVPQFLQRFPKSRFSDQLHALQGDLFWLRHRYRDAVDSYAKISSEPVSIRYREIDSLYRLGRYEQLLEKLDQCHVLAFEGKKRHLLVLYQGEALMQLASKTAAPERKELLFTRASLAYHQLLETDHALSGRLGLAEVHEKRGDYPAAVKIYRQLADENPARADEFLYHAGSLEAQYAPDQAVDTFAAVGARGGRCCAAAAASEAKLLFKLKRYRQLVRQEDRLGRHAQALIGRSYFALKDFKAACEKLEPLLESEKEKKPLLTALITCGHRLGEKEKLIGWADEFYRLYPDDKASASIQYLQAVAYQSAGCLQEAATVFERIFHHFPTFNQREEILYELAHLAYQQQQWGECRNHLNAFIVSYPSSSNLYRVHLLAGLLEYQGGQEPLKSLISHGEQALALNGNFSESDGWRLNLFNAYLRLAAESPDHEALAFLAKGAQHLQDVYHRNPEALDRDRKLWLAMYRYQSLRTICERGSFDEAITMQLLELQTLYQQSLDPEAIEEQQQGWHQLAKVTGWLSHIEEGLAK